MIVLRDALHNCERVVPFLVQALSNIFDLGLLIYFLLMTSFHHSFLPITNLHIILAPMVLLILLWILNA